MLRGESPPDPKQNINRFIEAVVHDSQTGGYVRQAAIHRSWHAHIAECRRTKKFAGILAPWGHGKSLQMSIAVPLYELGMNPNLRIKIVTNTPEFAQARLQACQEYILRSPEYRRMFPHIRPLKAGDWNKHKLVVLRDSFSPDGSIEAYGILQTATGGRADLLIFDDVVDLNNAILSPAMRPKVTEAFHSVWLPRLEPGGFAIYIATRWHLEDITGVLLANPQWRFLVQAVSEDMTCIESEVVGHHE